MRVWSKGLGKMTLDMDLGSTTPSVERDKLVLSGKIGPPVHWDFWIKIEPDDMSNMIRIAMKKPSFRFAFKSLPSMLKRKKKEEKKEEDKEEK